ncbi:MAG: NADH-quinone oxidoreductase subunit K [Actinobacteria bacterium]|nr:NADH-quinone oxidoreductase subunit K [Actinomycetota bacterium]
MTLVLPAVVGVLFASGTYLLLQRTLTRIVIGVSLLSHGANVLLLLSGLGAGEPPIVEGHTTPVRAYTDPLPQALVLTAIVISFGMTAFLLSMAYRSWRLTHSDEVRNDLEDRYLHARGGGPA